VTSCIQATSTLRGTSHVPHCAMVLIGGVVLATCQ